METALIINVKSSTVGEIPSTSFQPKVKLVRIDDFLAKETMGKGGACQEVRKTNDWKE